MPRKPKAVTQLNTYYNNCVLMGDVLEDDSILVDCFRMKKIKRLKKYNCIYYNSSLILL